MLCFQSPTVSTMTLCGAPVGLDWFDVALTDDHRKITCRSCRSSWNYENPDSRIPVRELPYVQRYSVTTHEGKLSDLSWEDALLYYRTSRRDQLDRHIEEGLTGKPYSLVACYFMTGARVIAALLIVDGHTVVNTAAGVGIERLTGGDD